MKLIEITHLVGSELKKKTAFINPNYIVSISITNIKSDKTIYSVDMRNDFHYLIYKEGLSHILKVVDEWSLGKVLHKK